MDYGNLHMRINKILQKGEAARISFAKTLIFLELTSINIVMMKLHVLILD